MIPTSSLFPMLLAIAVPQPCAPDRAASPQIVGAAAVIRRAERKWAASIETHKDVFLERYAAPGFVAVFDGEVMPRASMIAGARKRKAGTASVILGPFRVHVAGSSAVAEGSELWRSSSGEKSRIIWSDLWVRCGGGWRLLTSTSASSPVAASRPFRRKEIGSPRD